MVEEVTVDGDGRACNLQRCDLEPLGVNVVRRLIEGALPQEEDVGDDLGACLGPLLAIALRSLLQVRLRSVVFVAVIPGLLALVMVLFVRERETSGSSKAQLDLTIRRLRQARIYGPVFGAVWLAGGVQFLLGGARPITIGFWIAMSLVLVVQGVLSHRELGVRIRERAELG